MELNLADGPPLEQLFPGIGISGVRRLKELVVLGWPLGRVLLLVGDGGNRRNVMLDLGHFVGDKVRLGASMAALVGL